MSLESFIGGIVVVKHIILFESGRREEAYIQGILRYADDEFVRIEQYLTFCDYLLAENPPSVIRELEIGKFTFISTLRH